MIRPAFQRAYLGDGRVLILKTEEVCEVDGKDAQRYDLAASSFRKNLPKYNSSTKENHKGIVAGILLEFNADKFSRNDVFVWCAFASQDLTLEAISGALTQLQNDAKRPIKQLGKGRWQVQRDNLKSLYR